RSDWSGAWAWLKRRGRALLEQALPGGQWSDRRKFLTTGAIALLGAPKAWEWVRTACQPTATPGGGLVSIVPPAGSLARTGHVQESVVGDTLPVSPNATVTTPASFNSTNSASHAASNAVQLRFSKP